MANGNFGGGNGTQANPWLIEDAFDLDAIRSKGVHLAYKLVNDIDLNIYPFNAGTGWTPIPSATGWLDGNFKTIRNLFIARNTSYSGLFGLGYPKVKNLTLEGFRINAEKQFNTLYIGALIGEVNNGTGTIENVVVTDFKAYGYYLGGICGQMNGTIKNCVVEKTTLMPSSQYVGGITGSLNGGNISGCITEISWDLSSYSTTTYNGGIVGVRNGGNIGPHNYYDNTFGNFAGYSVSVTGINPNTSYTAAQMKNPANFVGVGATAFFDDIMYTEAGVKAWVIDTLGTVRPKHFMEKGINKTFLHYSADYNNLVEFGDVLEGSASPYRAITLKLCYDVLITKVDVSWARRSGVSSLTGLEFSTNATFSDPTTTMSLTGSWDKGAEITIYMRVKTQVGVTGDGLFDLYVDVAS